MQRTFLSEGHPLLEKSLLSENDLDLGSFWLLEEGHCFRDQILMVCSATSRQNPFKNIQFSGGSLETLKKMVTRHSGHTLLPELATLDMSEMEKKAYLRPFASPVPSREVSFIHTSSFYKHRILGALNEIINDSLPTQIHRKRRDEINIVPV